MNERAQTVPPPSIPLGFVGAAMATLGATLAWAAVGNPQPLALLHALVVGVFLTVAMGLLYQFVPVVSMARLRLPWLAFVHLGLALCGTGFLVYGFQQMQFALVRTGGLLHATGVILEIVVLVSTVSYGKPPPPARGAALGLLWLLVTIAIGTWIAARFAAGLPDRGLVRDHALFGLVGFFGTLILALTLRLLRMFERVDREAHTMVLALSASAAAILAVFLPPAVVVIPIVALAACAELIALARARNPAYQRETLWYACVSMGGAFAGSVMYFLGHDTVGLVCAVWLFIGTAVIGYLQRIVPFIWWIRRSRREGTRNIPTLAQMNASPLGYGILVLWTVAGVAALTLPQLRVAAIVGVAAWLALLVQLGRPFTLSRGTLAT